MPTDSVPVHANLAPARPAVPARTFRIRVACLIAASVGPAFAVFNLLTPGQLLLGQIELAANVLLVLPALYLAYRTEHTKPAENLLLMAAMVIFGALVVLGGVAGSGLFWAYTVPLLVFFLKGQHAGRIISLGFALLMALYFLGDGPTKLNGYVYEALLWPQFLLSLVYFTVLAAAFNLARVKQETQVLLARDAAHQANQALAQAAQDLQRQNENISRILSTASHDLRQPAHALGLLTAGLKRLSLDKDGQSLAQDIDTSVAALQNMLNAYFDYSAMGARGQALRIEACSVDLIFDRLASFFSEKARQQNLRLCIKKSGLWVRSDPLLLQRVLLNLLSNALRYTERGTVLLCCRPTANGQQLRIQVRDSGIGIAPSESDKVFDEFYQVGNRARSLGLGLGLSVVRRACEQLQHPLSLASAPGCGSTFTLRVPLVQRSEGEGEGEGEGTMPLGQDKDQTVLLIDRDCLSRNALSSLLQAWGYSVVAVSSAGEANAQFDPRAVPMFMVSDYRLQDSACGIEAIGQIRQRAQQAIPACLISASQDASLAQKASDAGMWFLQKPVAPAKLRSLLRRATEHSDDTLWP